MHLAKFTNFMNSRIYIAFFGLLLYCGTLFSQEKDSLASMSFKKLESNYYKNRNKDATLAKIYAKEFLKKARNENDHTRIAKSYTFLGNLEKYNGNYSEALQYIDTCIAYSKKFKEDRVLLLAYKVKGNIYRNIGDYDNSISYHLKVDSLAKQANNPLERMRSIHNIAIIKEEIGSVEEAILMFQENLTKLESNNPSVYNKYLHINTLISLTATHIELNPQKATNYNKDVKKLATQNDDIDALSYHYMFEGKIAYQQKQYDKALNAFHVADSIIVSSLNNKGNLFIIYRLKGKILFEQNKCDEAITILEKAKKLYANKGYQHFELLEIFTLLAKCYSKIGQKDKALENFNLGSSFYDKNDDVKIKVSEKIKEKYEIANFKDEIIKLKNATLIEQKNNNILKIIGAFLVTLLFLLIGLFLKNKRKNKKKFNALLSHIDTLEKQQKQSITNQKKSINTKSISDEKITSLLHSLEKYESKFEFLNPKTSLSFVAKKLNTNTNYLSKIINTHKGKSFTNYITELRINYALQRIKNDKVFRSFSIKGIAEELGFKSEGSFSRAFKQQTGIYPSYFIKNITPNS